MFGLGRKNREKKEEQRMKEERENPEFVELVERWEAFLKKIETRFNESLEHAEVALLDNLEESNYDINPTLQAWHGIKSELTGLIDKIDETYENKVEPEMLEYIEYEGDLEEGNKGRVLDEKLSQRIERFEFEIEGKVSLEFYNHAIQLLDETFTCTQCGGKLELKEGIFRTHYVDCQFCNTVNTFTPNDKIAQISWVTNNIAKYKTLPQWDTMKMALNEYQEMPSYTPNDEELDLETYKKAMKKREETETNYWTAYLEERIKIQPEFKETFEQDLEGKMRFFYQERQRDFNY